jgi:hypothetical protein
MAPLNPRQKRLLFGLLPGPALVAGGLVMAELSGPLGWETAALWALGAALGAAGAFAVYFRWNERRKARAGEKDDSPVSRPLPPSPTGGSRRRRRR